jgi:hypothetical protein
MSDIQYVIKQAHGIYEILRVDGTHHYVVVQTNIRTREKAEEACRRWQEAEAQMKSHDLPLG